MILGIGIVIVVIAIGLVTMVGGAFVDSERVVGVGAILTMGPLIAILGFGVALILNPQLLDKPSLAIGHCYQAYETHGMVPVLAGKVTVIVPTRGVDLAEISCP